MLENRKTGIQNHSRFHHLPSHHHQEVDIQPLHPSPAFPPSTLWISVQHLHPQSSFSFLTLALLASIRTQHRDPGPTPTEHLQNFLINPYFSPSHFLHSLVLETSRQVSRNAKLPGLMISQQIPESGMELATQQAPTSGLLWKVHLAPWIRTFVPD